MQCLYCKRKLGLFASKKYPFCSEQHEVAYQDEQAGLALRRIMDPLFTAPLPKVPLQPAPPKGALGVQGEVPEEVEAAPQAVPEFAAPLPPAAEADSPLEQVDLEPSEAPAEPETSIFQPVSHMPALMPFVEQVRPAARAPEVQAEIEPLGFEASTEKARLPEGLASLIEDEIPVQAVELSPDEPATIEASPIESAVIQEPGLDSYQLHPALEQKKPDWIEPDAGQPSRHMLSAKQATPVGFETQPTRALPREVSLDGEAPGQELLRAEPRTSAKSEPAFEPVKPEAPPEEFAGTTELPASGPLPDPEPPPLAGLVSNGTARAQLVNGHAGDAPRMESRLDPPPLALRYPFADLAPLSAQPERRVPALGLRWEASLPATAPAPMDVQPDEPVRRGEPALPAAPAALTGPGRVPLRPGVAQEVSPLPWTGPKEAISRALMMELAALELAAAPQYPSAGAARAQVSLGTSPEYSPVSWHRQAFEGRGGNLVTATELAPQAVIPASAPGSTVQMAPVSAFAQAVVDWGAAAFEGSGSISPALAEPAAEAVIPAAAPASTVAMMPARAFTLAMVDWDAAAFEGSGSISTALAEPAAEAVIPASAPAATVPMATVHALARAEIDWAAAAFGGSESNSVTVTELAPQAVIPAPAPADAMLLAAVHAFAPPEIDWDAAAFEGSESSSPALAEPAAEVRIPALELTVTVPTTPAQTSPQALERYRTAPPPLHWKVLSGLREAPAKVGLPEFLAGSRQQLANAQRMEVSWTVPDDPAVWRMPEAEIRLWDGAVIAPSWRESQPIVGLGSTLISGQPWLAEALVPSQDILMRMEDARSPGEAIRVPGIETLLAVARLTGAKLGALQPEQLAWRLQFDRRRRYRTSELLAALNGFQKARAASFIEIPKPELHHLNLSDLPAPGASLSWKGVHPELEGRQPGSLVPLHPDVQAPKMAA